MAIFRKIHVSFWKDEFVQSLTPEQKYFYLYLMTNERTTQCGVYEITYRQICFDTGYNEDTIRKLIETFSDFDKIRYSKETKEMALKNWGKYNDSTSSKVKSCVNKELLSVKDASLIDYIGKEHPTGIKYNKNYRVNDGLRDEIFKKDNYQCQKCKSRDNLSIDHIIPRILGGSSIPENLRCLCRSCNSSRPAFGEELVKEVIESGYDYDSLFKIATQKAYKYSIGSQTQEEQEQEQEQEEESEQDINQDDVPPIKSLSKKPTKEQFLKYCEERCATEGLKFFQYKSKASIRYDAWAANNWQDLKGNKISNWKSKIVANLQYWKDEAAKPQTSVSGNYEVPEQFTYQNEK